jgi:hypothetical protein
MASREQVSPEVSPVHQSDVFTMFEDDLSVQHASFYGTGRFSIVVKETDWGTKLFSKYMSISKDGGFTGIDLSAGGLKPPRGTASLPRGINIFNVPDDAAYE